MTVGELLVKLGLDTKAYKQGLAQMEKQTQAAGTRLGDIFKNAFSVAIGIGFFEAIRRGFRSVVGEAVNFNTMMEQAQIGFTTMLGSAEKAQAFLEEMANFAAKTPFEYPDLLDAARHMMAIGFAADEVLPTLKAVGDAAAGLGVGKEGIDRITRALGQMRAKGRVSAEEMMQLTEAGIPAWDMLAEAMGKSVAEVRKLSEKGLIPANKAVQILIEGMEKRFPDMMEKMENTWMGVTSTIKDVWRMTIGALTSNLFRGLTKWLQGVRDVATSFYNFFMDLKKQGIDASTALRLALARTFGPDVSATISIITNTVRTAWAVVVSAAVAIKTHWAIIKPLVIGVVTAFLTFKIVTPIITSVTMAMQALNGTLVVGPPLFMLISKAVGIYRLQLHLASMAGIAHVGVLQAIRTALYSVYAALGPLGLALLAVAGALTVGIMLWNKYAASVEQANLRKAMEAVKQKTKEYTDSTQKAAKGTEEQADAMNEAGKVANKNIQSFDEVHQLIEDTAGAAEGVTAGLDEMATPVLDIPELNLEEIFTQAKPTLSGFWQWIKDGAIKVLEGIKNATISAWNWIISQTEPIWRPVVDFFTGFWNGIKEKWSAFKGWASGLWEGVKRKWGSFTSWVAGWAVPLWNSVKEAWSIFISWASGLWEGVKIAWGTFIGWLSEKWSWIVSTAMIAWGLIRDYIINPIQTTWNWLVIAWNTICIWLSEKWGWIKEIAKTTWNWIKERIVTPVQEAWDWLVEAWETVGSWLSEKWEEIKNTVETTWNFIRENIINPIQEAWTWLETTWDTITTFLERTWEDIKTTASRIWDGIAKAIKSPINIIIKAFNWMITQLNKIHFSIPDWVPILGGRSWGFNLSKLSLLPLAEGGIVTRPTTALVGEAGPEAVIPLNRGGFVDDMASTIAQAVYTAIRDAIRVVYAEQRATQRENAGNTTIIVKVGEETLVDKVISGINRRSRISGETIITI